MENHKLEREMEEWTGDEEVSSYIISPSPLPDLFSVMGDGVG